ncbi:hypothetical protein GBO34_00890 [Roseivirga pacifica]|uniref:hypothetical protein n=1 Tax=Roseivirga pacifica TaxID=1267423 RepID=UPI0020950B2F|nr:hypothetical protein [Roseivirga pacifica]MCO6367869.1 hypothetical protein [Roseivirga pacifica]MCO6377241.1 hypothetical protein [Roseivirga pacifica]
MGKRKKTPLGDPIHIRPTKSQRECFNEFVKNENIGLLNEGNKARTDSDHGRFIFGLGLQAAGYPAESEVEHG